ncbi:MAG: peptidylprolyl isomerase [Alphaproteobacteria bacterium]
MKKQILKLAALFIAFLVTTSNVKAEDSAKTSTSDDKKIVATIGDKNFYLSDVKQLQESNPQLKLVPLDVVYDNLVEHLVDGYLVTQKARALGLDKDPNVVEAMKHAEDLILRNVYVQKEVAAKLEKVNLKDMYKKHLKENPSKEQIKARHILLKTQEDALKVIEQLKKGADFAELAKEKSIGPSAPTGGDLGYFDKDAMVAEFADAAFAMKVGDFSEKPVQTQFGWHVIKIEDRKMAKDPTMKELEPTLKAEYAENVIEEIVKNLRSKTEVKLFDMKGNAK